MTDKTPVEVRLREALQETAREAPLPPDFAASVADTLPERSTARSGILRLALPSLAASGVLVVALVTIALLRPLQTPAPGAGGGWGPLAVAPGANGDLALTAGILRIGDECVVLEQADGQVTLLVWPNDQTSWDAANRTITFANRDDELVVLADGDRVSLGGSGGSTLESGIGGEEWRNQIPWISQPAPSCPLEIRWSIGEVVTGGEGAVAPSSSATAGVYLPTYRPMDIVPEAQIGGVLVQDDGCLWLEHAEGRALPLWPAGSRIEQDGSRVFVVNSGGARAEVGTEVVGGGGEYGPENYDFVVDLIGEGIPERCRGDGFYWLVYDVRPANN